VRTVDVNLTGVMRTVSATAAHVIAARGYYLLIASTASFAVLPGMAAYCASKAGVEHFGHALRLELRHLGVRVGTAHPAWIGTHMVRDAQEDLPSFRDTLRRLPWPLRTVTSVERCAESLVDALEHRRRRVYVPRAIGGYQALRSVLVSPLAELIVSRRARVSVPQMEAEVRALGRSFGKHSTETGR
jgi:short-subunit dehydrogenase